VGAILRGLLNSLLGIEPSAVRLVFLDDVPARRGSCF
jgi:hypothetical protein